MNFTIDGIDTTSLNRYTLVSLALLAALLFSRVPGGKGYSPRHEERVALPDLAADALAAGESALREAVTTYAALRALQTRQNTDMA